MKGWAEILIPIFPVPQVSRSGRRGRARRTRVRGAGQEGLDEAHGRPGQVVCDLFEHCNVPDEDRDRHPGGTSLQHIEPLEGLFPERIHTETVEGLGRVGNDLPLSEGRRNAGQHLRSRVERIYGQEQGHVLGTPLLLQGQRVKVKGQRVKGVGW